MATVTHFPKRLFLSKDNVYIDLLEAVPSNVLNGVRFLYKQFVQKPGVIINDPPACEQETQVVMFLRGIHKGLDQQPKPVLILCHSSKLTIWMDCLLRWMPNYDEVVAMDYVKPTAKKSIYVITTDRLEAYCRREWGIAVIDDDAFLQYKLPPNTFRVLFKIYITTDDLRDHLPKFAQIHKWLYPDMVLDVDQFRPKRLNISDFLEKRIRFSAFAEDLIVRCNKPGPAIRYPEPVEPTPTPRITRKNKDATGTKIKRTKRKVENDNTESANKKIAANNISEINTSVTCASKVDVLNGSEENMDIESFIREREPIKMDELRFIPDIDSIPIDSDKNNDEDLEENSDDIKLNYSEDLDTDDAAYALYTQYDGLESNELESKEIEIGNVMINDSDTANTIEETAPPKNDQNSPVENTTNSETKETEKQKTELKYSELENEETAPPKNEVLDSPVENTTNSETKEIEEQKAELKYSELENEETAPPKNEVQDSPVENTTNSETKDSELENENYEETNGAQINNETKLESKDEVKTVKENGVKKEGTKSDDLDSKWEEMALKKFKGSLLDRIF